MLYRFIKREKKLTKKKKRITGAAIICLGLGIFIYFFFPVISYQLFFGSKDTIHTLLPSYDVVSGRTIGSLVSQGIANFAVNFNDARNWYPQIRASGRTSVLQYKLSVPSLKIQDAEVSTTDYDLSHHLVQYTGTSIPGENGTAVIFGHSTLPQWFDPQNYKAIFATLHLIKKGDEILTKVNGITYTYKVFSIVITEPEDTNMFTQSYDHSYITIVTCTPPGTVWKRLVVRASLEETGKKITFNN